MFTVGYVISLLPRCSTSNKYKYICDVAKSILAEFYADSKKARKYDSLKSVSLSSGLISRNTTGIQ